MRKEMWWLNVHFDPSGNPVPSLSRLYKTKSESSDAALNCDCDIIPVLITRKLTEREQVASKLQELYELGTVSGGMPETLKTIRRAIALIEKDNA